MWPQLLDSNFGLKVVILLYVAEIQIIELRYLQFLRGASKATFLPNHVQWAGLAAFRGSGHTGAVHIIEHTASN